MSVRGVEVHECERGVEVRVSEGCEGACVSEGCGLLLKRHRRGFCCLYV